MPNVSASTASSAMPGRSSAIPAAPSVTIVRSVSLPIISRRISNRSAITPPNSSSTSRGSADSVSSTPATAGEPRCTAVQDRATYQTWSPRPEIVCPAR